MEARKYVRPVVGWGCLESCLAFRALVVAESRTAVLAAQVRAAVAVEIHPKEAVASFFYVMAGSLG